jgi:ribosomal protein S18 acetylase RimI-like enzyme
MPIFCRRESGLTVDDYTAVQSNPTMRNRRPLTNKKRIRAMLDGANFIVTARNSTGELVGLVRGLTDHAWICYIAEVAVTEIYAGQGIGEKLMESCVDILGPKIGIVLSSDPEAVGFYERIGMKHTTGFFRPREDSD